MNDELDTELWKDAVLRRREHNSARNEHRLPYRHNTDVDNLIKICSKKLEVDPNHKKALYTRASSYMRKGLYLEAIRDCEELVRLDA
jgi:tetratricopeptide (TPR) repeat protein